MRLKGSHAIYESLQYPLYPTIATLVRKRKEAERVAFVW